MSVSLFSVWEYTGIPHINVSKRKIHWCGFEPTTSGLEDRVTATRPPVLFTIESIYKFCRISKYYWYIKIFDHSVWQINNGTWVQNPVIVNNSKTNSAYRRSIIVWRASDLVCCRTISDNVEDSYAGYYNFYVDGRIARIGTAGPYSIYCTLKAVQIFHGCLG